MKNLLRNLLEKLPEPLYRGLFSAYHFALSFVGALRYGFPSRRLCVIAVTGTKGKSSVVEIIRAILTEAGNKTASAGTINFCIGDECRPNKYKMTMIGRFFLQKFLREAVNKGATHAVIEMTSEGAIQHRHRFIDLDALVFTNLAPEHLERHGGLEQYAAAKLSIAWQLERSCKRPRIIVANADDAYGRAFLAVKAEIRAPFSLKDAEPYHTDDKSAQFSWRGDRFTAPLPGLFSLKNVLAAITVCDALGVPKEAIQRAVETPRVIPGRAERVECGQDFTVIVDYAHTPDSLRALYETFGGNPDLHPSPQPSPREGRGGNHRRICVLGSTGGGRDTWKRPAMGAIADEMGDIAILTDEDPYDENPEEIVEAIATGFTHLTPIIIMDRRQAIAAALKEAKTGDYVLISGKGTDPYIMKAGGKKEVWSDKKVAEEELRKLFG